MTDGTIVGKHD